MYFSMYGFFSFVCCIVLCMFYNVHFIILYTFVFISLQQFPLAFCSEGNPPPFTHYFMLSLITEGVCGLMRICQGRQRHHCINITITTLHSDLFSALEEVSVAFPVCIVNHPPG